MTPPADRLRKHPLAFAGAIGVLALLTLLFFHRPLFGGGILVDYDLFTYFYPYRDLVGQAFAEGRFPLWNPSIFFGAPLFANVQSAVLYPLNLMTWWMEPPQQVILSAIVHTIIAGILAWALGLFGFRLRMASSLGLGIAYMFSGFMAQQVGHINQLNASAWLPGMMLMLLIATRRRSVLAIAAGAVFASFQFLAGHTQEFYLSGIVLAVTALLLASRSIVTSGRYRRAKANGVPWIRSSQKVIVARPGIILWPAAALALMFGVGLALSGVQLLPTLELSSIGARAGGLSFNEGRTFSLPPWFLIWALLPGYIENPFSEFTAYVGVSGMALAVLGLVTSPRRWTRNLAALLVLLGTAIRHWGVQSSVRTPFQRRSGAELVPRPGSLALRLHDGSVDPDRLGHRTDPPRPAPASLAAMAENPLGPDPFAPLLSVRPGRRWGGGRRRDSELWNLLGPPANADCGDLVCGLAGVGSPAAGASARGRWHDLGIGRGRRVGRRSVPGESRVALQPDHLSGGVSDGPADHHPARIRAPAPSAPSRLPTTGCNRETKLESTRSFRRHSTPGPCTISSRA